MLKKCGSLANSAPLHGSIPIYHRYTLGVAGERFFKAIRDRKQLMASDCPNCNDRFLPPKIYCEICFHETQDWSEVEGPGYIAACTAVHYSLEGERLEEPLVVAVINWPGVRGGLIHKVRGAGLAELALGTTVEPAWSERRSGTITDIDFFRPVES